MTTMRTSAKPSTIDPQLPKAEITTRLNASMTAAKHTHAFNVTPNYTHYHDKRLNYHYH